MNKNTLNIFLFVVGLLAHVRVHIVGMIGISEILICLAAPLYLIKDFNALRRDGFLRMLTLMALTCIGCLVASWYNHTPFGDMIRGFATPVVFLCSFVFFHHFLRGQVNSLKWLLAGLALTIPISLLVNGVSVEEVMAGTEMNEIGDSKYLMSVLASPLFTLPVFLFYTRMPVIMSASILFLGGLFKISTTASGRSAGLVLFAAALLVLIGGRSKVKMFRIRKHFLLYFILGIVGVVIAKNIYSAAAVRGYLGYVAEEKYVQQTTTGNGVVDLLIGGRGEVFMGAYAAIHQPIIGFGPWAIDWKGYADEFRQKFGYYDYEEESKRARYLALMGYGSYVHRIPAHSCLIGGWLWYGIFGLIMWLYILHLVFKFFMKATDAVPQWWPLFSVLLPRFLWDIFFSPFGARVQVAAIVVALLFAIGAASGRIKLDPDATKEKFLNW